MQTKKNIIKPFSAQARYAKQRKPSWTFLCSSKVCETQKTFMMLSCSIEICEKKFGRIFATVRESPPYLSIRSQPPTLHQIYRVTKQLQTRSRTEKPRAKRKKRKPMRKRTKNETKRKKKIKMIPCMLFSCLLKPTYKRNTNFFYFINGQQRPTEWPINPQNMPNGVAKHAKPRPARCLTETRYMPNRNTKDGLSQCRTCLIAKRIYLFGYV